MLNNHRNNPTNLLSALPMRNLLLRFPLLASLILLLWQPAAAQPETITAFQLINERLKHMEDVAMYKSVNGLPVEDLPREEVVIENAVLAAESQGLIGDSIENFFITQINVAKAIQYRSLADWLSSPISKPIPDLPNQIRPKLTELGDEIVKELALLLSHEGRIGESLRASFQLHMSVNKISAAEVDLLFDSLLLVRSE
ncbi:MAG: gamma subclass chorismate mutase AroQ [Pseudohongiellaceae bacterium]|uniref:chorismate mutase n=1 Tax=OM182 bacterium MED-G28 TaxID=1986256 RepID=A0A2A5WD68_9GAMM|nr:MAG: chorismate mutase AroQ, gamma subclass [OM182 bacterium MED-G28]